MTSFLTLVTIADQYRYIEVCLTCTCSTMQRVLKRDGDIKLYGKLIDQFCIMQQRVLQRRDNVKNNNSGSG